MKRTRRLWLVATLASMAVRPTRAYRFEDNVAEFLTAGRKALAAGDALNAQVELENVLLLSPGNADAHEMLVEVYLKLGRKDLARRTVERIARGRLMDSARLGALEAKVQGAASGQRVARGSFWDGDAPPLPPPGAVAPDRKRVNAEVAVVTLDTGGGLGPAGDPLDPALIPGVPTPAPPLPRPGDRAEVDSLLGEIDLEDGPNSDTGDALEVEGRVPDGSNPRALFEFAVSLFRRTNDTRKAGILLVKALEAAPELLAEPDGGLFDATYRAYTRRLEGGEGDVQTRFVLAFLEEKRGEEKLAVRQYKEIASSEGESKMGRLAQARAEALEYEIERKAKEKAAILARLAAEKAEKLLPDIARGEHPDIEDPKEYEARGLERYRKYQDGRSKDDLRYAKAWIRGAITRDPGVASFHYRLALIRVDEATEGIGDPAEAQGEARRALQKVLALNPDADLRSQAEKLLQSLPAGG